MILGYGYSIVGTAHIKKGAGCQDANTIAKLPNGWTVACVADGVGSSKYSDVASKTAVTTVAKFLATAAFESTDDLISDVLPKAYALAQAQIEKIADEGGHEYYHYDTTLTIALYNGETLAYGHSGDGGIVGLTYDGDYINITAPQKGKDGFTVIPLRGGSGSWEFGKRDEAFASVLLATDGVLDVLQPYLLRNQPTEVYVPLIRYFMDNAAIKATDKNIKKVAKEREKFLLSQASAAITDDKTLVVLFNTSVVPKVKEDSFYAEPDWAGLQEAWNRKAYPHLYKEKEPESEPEPVIEPAKGKDKRKKK